MLLVLGSGVLAIAGYGGTLKAAVAAKIAYKQTAVLVRAEALPWADNFYHALLTQNSSKNDAVPIATSSCEQTLPSVLKTSGPLHQKAKDASCVTAQLAQTNTPAATVVQPVASAPASIKAVIAATPHPAPTTAQPSTAQTVAEVVRIPDLEALSDRALCTRGTTLDVVAHEDDDLLFMNPDVQTDIAAGRCVRTVYITAGDAGGNTDYWQGRENGAKAAYASMFGAANNWTDKTELLNDRLVSVSYLNNVPQVALTFLHLPDGNLHGEGFATTSAESLQKLVSGELPELHTVDGRSTYTKDELVNTLLAVMQADQPSYIRTQNPTGAADGDHADHAAVGQLTTLASAMYVIPHKLATYMGYPDTHLDVNLTSDQIMAKKSVFLSYAQHDEAVCQTDVECAQNVTYGNFLPREYKLSEVASGQ